MTSSFEVDTAGLALAVYPAEGAPAVIGLRPHDIEVAPIDAAEVVGTVELVEELGAWTTMHLRLGDEKELVRVAALSGPAPRRGDRVGLRLRRDRLHLFDAATRRNLLTP